MSCQDIFIFGSKYTSPHPFIEKADLFGFYLKCKYDSVPIKTLFKVNVLFMHQNSAKKGGLL